MNKPAFDRIMKAIKMKESTKIVSFLDCFEYIKPLTFNTKSKLGLLMTEKQWSLNQIIFNEGSSSDFLYLIKDGDFEVTKDIFIKTEKSQRILGFRRMCTNRSANFLKKIFNHQTQMLVSNWDDLLLDLKNDYKSASKLQTRISLLSSYGTFGITELMIGCPYRITNVKWVSLKGSYYIITKDNFFRKVPENSEKLIELVVQKTEFFDYRIRNQAQVNNAEIDPLYLESNLFAKKPKINDSFGETSSLSNISQTSK